MIQFLDTAVTENVIREGFKKRQYFTAVIARPTSAEARRQVEDELRRSTRVIQEQEAAEEPSVRMAKDVHLIAQREIERLTNAQVSFMLL